MTHRSQNGKINNFQWDAFDNCLYDTDNFIVDSYIVDYLYYSRYDRYNIL
jgi:hypothetical protein